MSNPNHSTVDYRSSTYPSQSMHPQGSQPSYPQGYYPDQYQQYQQLLNGNTQQPYNSYYMFGQAQPQQAGQQSQSGQPQSQNQQSQQTHQGQQSQPGQGSDATYAYGRYHNSYGLPPGGYASYQTVPQAGGSAMGAQQQQSQQQQSGGSSTLTQQQQQQQQQHQQQQQQGTSALSQPQPQHFVQMSGSATSSNSTPLSSDTLNATTNSSVGQYQPPGIRPRVTTTMWEDEKTLCYQVDANNVSVVRRADNNMINGTKLLNVAQMTRGRRDGILKSEKVRHVVKIGSMHLKGVWIPFDRALAMAQREGIVDLLYPLFVRDIKRVILTGVTPSSSATASSAANASSSVASTAATAATPSSAVAAKTAASQTPATASASTAAPGHTAASGLSYGNYYSGYSQYLASQRIGIEPIAATSVGRFGANRRLWPTATAGILLPTTILY
ncbi:hypothetical protein PGUG_03651 [Meyerozyma guilliermondii ATCC 6260]|uniref:HTH APSES-type domain-containing protein n=1 Tax=Meyerozyma guilliermondii (strain ATCC 6260 / CBS 566 / DSM 6381 / JCM 1539 / NBRC 10279 / NRRL Y-324) TaxID=294746 RepID=A5DK50_PICGU|nr:uncharacterized protein PGUG_03651 [Meyerozyma guilliermondii ATCC 6260]EDK39553.2 hypothetical protein PGUG_03651 [Meyerozyma guilliermondii ATCC 6260]